MTADSKENDGTETSLPSLRLPSANCTKKCPGRHEFHFRPPHSEVEAEFADEFGRFPEDSRVVRWMNGETLEPKAPPLGGTIPTQRRAEAFR